MVASEIEIYFYVSVFRVVKFILICTIFWFVSFVSVYDVLLRIDLAVKLTFLIFQVQTSNENLVHEKKRTEKKTNKVQ